MQTISQAANAFNLSRSTLLYYDKIGLCRPTYRTAAGYRLYAQEDLHTLRLICQYRESGMSLKTVARILDDPEPSRIVSALKDELERLNAELRSLRKQQDVAINLLKSYKSEHQTHKLDKAGWIQLLRSCGMEDADMHQWHVMFEKQSPGAHQDFLESLGIPPAEIVLIRKNAREQGWPTG